MREVERRDTAREWNRDQIDKMCSGFGRSTFGIGRSTVLTFTRYYLPLVLTCSFYRYPMFRYFVVVFLIFPRLDTSHILFIMDYVSVTSQGGVLEVMICYGHIVTYVTVY